MTSLLDICLVLVGRTLLAVSGQFFERPRIFVSLPSQASLPHVFYVSVPLLVSLISRPNPLASTLHSSLVLLPTSPSTILGFSLNVISP